MHDSSLDALLLEYEQKKLGGLSHDQEVSVMQALSNTQHFHNQVRMSQHTTEPCPIITMSQHTTEPYLNITLSQHNQQPRPNLALNIMLIINSPHAAERNKVMRSNIGLDINLCSVCYGYLHQKL